MDEIMGVVIPIVLFIVMVVFRGANKQRRRSAAPLRHTEPQSHEKVMRWITEVAGEMVDEEDGHQGESVALSMEGHEPESHDHGGLLSPSFIAPRDSEPYYAEAYSPSGSLDFVSTEGYEPQDHAHGGRMNPHSGDWPRQDMPEQPMGRAAAHNQLRQAIILSEILGPPASRRRRAIH